MYTNRAEQQPYDSLLKHFLEGQPEAILPLLLAEIQPGLQVVEELNVEVLIPPRRTDRVYLSSVGGRSKIIHVEIESGANAQMDKRLLIYNALLHEKHALPVHSIIIYPFEVAMVHPPMRVTDGAQEDIVTFRYRTIPLWKLDARAFVEQGAIPLYGLLPAMDGVTKEMLLLAIEQMIEYYKDNETRLRDELLCFSVLLRRAHRLPEHDMPAVLERIRMIDPLLREDPWVQSLVAEGRVEGRVEGIEEGELKATRAGLLRVVGLRFPELAALAEKRTACIESIDVLNTLSDQLVICADGQAAHNALCAVSPVSEVADT